LWANQRAAHSKNHKDVPLEVFDMGEFIVELWNFMKERKKFWLVPIIVMLVVLSGLMFLTSGSAVAPFIYTLF
jgi:hypothetical protein